MTRVMRWKWARKKQTKTNHKAQFPINLMLKVEIEKK
jgi:hypothetical protein